MVGILPLILEVSGHGVGSETLPPQMIGNYNSTILLKSSPNTVYENFQEKTISMTIYDIGSGEHLHNMNIDFTVSKNGIILFSDSFRIEEGTFSLVFSPPANMGFDKKIEKMVENFFKFGSNTNQITNDVFSEGGLYDFDIVVKSVDLFENDLENPAYFKGSLSIPKKYDFQTEFNNQVSITTFYDTIDSFTLSSNSMKFSMPFVWSDENISQVSVVHEEIHISKSMSSWITNNYDLEINGIPALGSLITIDDYSLENERVIHVIIPQKYLSDFKNDLQQMNFELKPNLSPDLPLLSVTRNGEYDVMLWWNPEKLVWDESTTFEIKIDELFVPNKIEEKIFFNILLIQDNKILFKKTIEGVKNTDSKQNTFKFTFAEFHEGSVKLLVDNIGSNSYADTEFVFVVNAPIIQFPITIPSQTSDGKEGNYDVDMTWIPADLMPGDESEFIFTIYEKDSRIPIYDAYYEFVLVQNNEEIFRTSGIAPAGGIFEDYVFTEENSGQVLVRLDKINKSDEYAEISVNVVPEFGLLSMLVLSIAFIMILVISKKEIFVFSR